jgi:hypothetical protein
VVSSAFLGGFKNGFFDFPEFALDSHHVIIDCLHSFHDIDSIDEFEVHLVSDGGGYLLFPLEFIPTQNHWPSIRRIDGLRPSLIGRHDKTSNQITTD